LARFIGTQGLADPGMPVVLVNETTAQRNGFVQARRQF
jgi:hypothetical protein